MTKNVRGGAEGHALGAKNEALALCIVKAHFPFKTRSHYDCVEDGWGWDLVCSDSDVEFGIQVKTDRKAADAYDRWAINRNVPIASIGVNSEIPDHVVVSRLRPRVARALALAKTIQKEFGPIQLPRTTGAIAWFFEHVESVTALTAFWEQRRRWTGRFVKKAVAVSIRGLPCARCGLRHGHKSTFLKRKPGTSIRFLLRSNGSPSCNVDVEDYLLELQKHLPVCISCNQEKE